MTGTTISLRPATPDDVPFLIDLERLPSSRHFVTRWSDEQHGDRLGDSDCVTLIALDGSGNGRGMLLFSGLEDDHGNVCLMRIIVDRPGEGLGGLLMEAAMKWVFTETVCHRLWLDVLADNHRGQRVYQRHGFQQEGVFRESFGLPDGGRADCLVMSMLRPEWDARR
tara:strand:+ start:4574 stop:5074 length:501 start_codon:yes stop_codon:yes gene_type:complete